MDTLITRCRRLISVTKTDFVRDIANRINWDCHLISIRGARGVEKTTLMLQYLKLHDIDYKSKLYVSLDSNYFTRHSLIANIHDSYIATDNIEFPSGNKIPLWAFGFIY